jgi:hypothetical protein
MWMCDGVAHSWTREADWYDSLRQEAVAIRDGGAPIVYAEYTAQIHDLASSLAGDLAFQRIPTVKERIRQAPRLSRSLEQALKRREVDYRTVDAVAREAWRIYQEEIIPAQEEEMAQQARRLGAQGLRKDEIAGRLRVTTGRLSRILARYGTDPQDLGDMDL